MTTTTTGGVPGQVVTTPQTTVAMPMAVGSTGGLLPAPAPGFTGWYIFTIKTLIHVPSTSYLVCLLSLSCIAFYYPT